MACSGCQKLPCPPVLAAPYRASCEVYRMMKTGGQGNFWWMVWGGKDGKKSMSKPFSLRGPIASSDHARAKKRFCSFFLVISQEDNMYCTCAHFHLQGSTAAHIGEPQSWAMGCAKNLLLGGLSGGGFPCPTIPHHSLPCHFLLFLPTLVTCIATHKPPTAQAAYRTSMFFPLLYNFH